ncbi:hypothetical protein SDC9_187103 [bioreactor metagenome]|uniref:Uncharacterized protein n=1 Tax=bioreactor metagenome TaxID=1076179 RepID=A0A645HKL7_9ZZZZ
MNDAAVVARLVTGRAGLFFQQRNSGVRIDINQLHGGRHTDNAAANNHKIIHPLFSFALTDESGSGLSRKRNNHVGASVRGAGQDAR